MTEDLERRLAASAGDAPLDLPALRVALARRAADDGLLDVAHGTYDSPLGPLTVFVTRRGLVRLSYADEPIDRQLDELAALISPRVMEAPERTDEVRGQLDAYFAGTRREFDVPIDWRLLRGFRRDVLRATARIPFGAVSSYRAIASAAGSPNAYRAAGNALGTNPVPIIVPCHRVLHAGGGLGGYTGGLDRKRFLLRLEGALESR
ncbi:MAG TPA: methylated-DNA--[protein]-cysteine S-methyltransferase [Candidatus Binatia bacterium]|nr:methylated-DNA--[protein]-cysteine S-methyltransferase [Candidatus Binatia bacterium]